MNAEQIKRCAAEIAKCNSKESIELVLARYVAEAKQEENDIAWLQACIQESIANNRKSCHDVPIDRLIRVLDRLERQKQP